MANQFLIKNTMADMRNLSASEIALLQGGSPTYAGVELLGYYEKGDTPAPIIYYLSDTASSDDGGSVIQCGVIKLEHNFDGEVDVEYYGILADNSKDNLNSMNFLCSLGIELRLPAGIIGISDTIFLSSGTIIRGKGIEKTTIVQLENTASIGHTPDENFLVIIDGQDNIEIENITLDSNGFNQKDVFRTSVIELKNSCNNIRLANCKFKNAFDTSYLGGFGLVSWKGGCNNLVVNNIFFEKIGQSDLGIFEGENWQIINMFSKENSYMPINIESSINALYLRNINISNVVIQDCARSAISVIYNNVSVGAVENINITNVTGIGVSKNDSTVGAIRFRGGRNVNISNVNFYNLGGTGVRMTVDSGQSVENVSISNLNIFNIIGTTGGIGISVEGTPLAKCKNISFSSIKIENTFGSSVIINHCDGLNITNLFATGSRNNGRGIQINDSDNIIISNCNINNLMNSAIGLNNSRYCVIGQCIIKNVIGSAIYLVNSTEISVSNCTVYDDRSSKLVISGIRVENSLSNIAPRMYFTSNNLHGIANPINTNMISIATNVIRTNILLANNWISDVTIKEATITYDDFKQ